MGRTGKPDIAYPSLFLRISEKIYNFLIGRSISASGFILFPGLAIIRFEIDRMSQNLKKSLTTLVISEI